MLKTVFKFLFAGLIIFWLISKGQLDFSLLLKTWNFKASLFVMIAVIISNIFLTSYRWKLLVATYSKEKLPLKSMISLTWIGCFFSSVLPGAVTGDFIKLLYARDLDRKLSKTFLLSTIFLDRFLGLFALLSLASFFSLIDYRLLGEKGNQLVHLAHVNFLLFAICLGFFLVLFVPKFLQQKVLALFLRIPVIGSRLEKTVRETWIVGEKKSALALCYLISLGVQTLSVFGFWFLISPFLDSPLTLGNAFTCIPAGFVTIAIPISPAGLGVGHLAFAKLFEFFGVGGGASLFNIYFILAVCVNLLGAIPYLMYGKRHSLKEASEMSEV